MRKSTDDWEREIEELERPERWREWVECQADDPQHAMRLLRDVIALLDRPGLQGLMTGVGTAEAPRLVAAMRDVSERLTRAAEIIEEECASALEAEAD